MSKPASQKPPPATQEGADKTPKAEEIPASPETISLTDEQHRRLMTTLHGGVHELVTQLRRLDGAGVPDYPTYERLGVTELDVTLSYDLRVQFGNQGESFNIRGTQVFHDLLDDHMLPEATEQVQAYVATQVARPFVARFQRLIQQLLLRFKPATPAAPTFGRPSFPGLPPASIRELPVDDQPSSPPTDQPEPPTEE